LKVEETQMCERIHPFFNGTAYGDWEESNCCRCEKYEQCEIYSALGEARLTDGTVCEAMARRMGYFTRGEHTNWACPEVVWTEAWQAEYTAMQAMRAEGSYLESREYWDWRHWMENAYYRLLEYYLRCRNCGGPVRVLFAADRFICAEAACICRDDACVQRRCAADPGNDWAAEQDIRIPARVAKVHEGGWGR